MSERKRITGRELIAEIQRRPEHWLDLPVRILVMDDGDDGGFLTTIEEDRFEVDGPNVLSLVSEADAPAVVQEPKTPFPEGFHWIGQPFTSCDMCGLPAWEHAGEARFPKGVFPFDAKPVLHPWGPGEADRIRAKWDPTFRPADTKDDKECTDLRCSRIDGRCVGMHCARCGEPCGSQGHRKCRDTEGGDRG